MMLFGRKKLTSLAKPLSLVDLRKRVKIVVIDDDENAFPTRILQDEGYTIEHWPEVKSLDRLERGDFDIIVLDIAGVAGRFAPDDGLGILDHLKRHNPAQIIVAFSGQSFDLSKQRFFDMADDVLPKPVNALKCKQILDQLIEAKFTVEHMWNSVVVIMRRENVPQKAIDKLEQSIAKAISKGDKPDYGALVSASVEKADLAARIAGVVTKIVTLCGLSL